MSDAVAVSPPDQTVWWDVAETVAAALAQLRLESSDVDAALITELVPVAGERINNRLDRTGPPATPVPASWSQALVRAVMALYRAKASPPSDPDLSLSLGYTPADPLAEVWPLLAPSRERWGIG